MPKRQWFVWMIVLLMIGCGPDTLFVRPALDTPVQHLANGKIFMDQSKWGDARREFERALELDPFLTDAYVGLAIATGRKGDFVAAAQILNQANQTVNTQQQREVVSRGDATLRQMIMDQGLLK